MDIFKFKKEDYKASKPTKKLLFIGGSNRGKTMHMINYFIHLVKECCAVVIVAPLSTHEDEKKLILKEWCDEAGMPIYFCTERNFNTLPKFPGESVFIVDDFYLSTDRDKAIEKLVKYLVNVGRHIGVHILYAAHLDIHLPSEIKYNCSNIFLNAQFAIKPDTYEHLQLRDASRWAQNADTYDWYIYDDSELREGKLLPLVWPDVPNRKALIDKIKHKLPKNCKEDIKKIKEDVKLREDKKEELKKMEKENEEHKKKGEINMVDVLAGKYYDKSGYKKLEDLNNL